MPGMIRMRFRAHDTFFIRKGWLHKGMKNVKADNSVFMGTGGNPMDILGIGANMVKSLRYWLQATGLTIEPAKGRRTQTLTPFGEIVFQNDPYVEEAGTLWLLHYNLAKNLEDATAWYFFFNEFVQTEFDKDDYITKLKSFIRLKGIADVSERSLEDDFTCIINTYVSRAKSNPEKIHPESNIDCPLGELGLIDIVDKKRKIYKKTPPPQDSIHPLIVLAVILDQAKGEREIRISSMQADSSNAGKIFNLDLILLTHILTKIELLGFIKVERTAGLDIIKIVTEMTSLDCVRRYYDTINNTQLSSTER